jgi:hypothetical protein
MAPAPRDMIIDHAYALHEGIDDRRPDKFEPARLQIA